MRINYRGLLPGLLGISLAVWNYYLKSIVRHAGGSMREEDSV